MAEGGSDEETQPYPSLELARRGRPALLPGLVCGGAADAQGLEGPCVRAFLDTGAEIVRSHGAASLSDLASVAVERVRRKVGRSRGVFTRCNRIQLYRFAPYSYAQQC